MFDYVSDLHLDNAMLGGPHGFLKAVDMSRFHTGATDLIIAGDTANHIADTVDAVNAVAKLYEHVWLGLGNHEQRGEHGPLAKNVTLLDDIHYAVRGDVGILGGCLGRPVEVLRAVDAFRKLEALPGIERIILVSHFVPTPRLGQIFGRDVASKSTDLLDRIGRPCKPTDVVFGHVHLACNAELDGVRLRANPRGYRGKLRDGTYWLGRFATFT